MCKHFKLYTWVLRYAYCRECSPECFTYCKRSSYASVYLQNLRWWKRFNNEEHQRGIQQQMDEKYNNGWNNNTSCPITGKWLLTFRFWYCRFYDWRERKLCANFQMEKKTSMKAFFFYTLFNFWFIYLNKAYLTLYILTYLQFINLFPWNCFHVQKQAYIGVLRKKGFWKYAVNLQENTQAKMWF